MLQFSAVSRVFLFVLVLSASPMLSAAPPGAGDPAHPPECRVRPAGGDEPAEQTHTPSRAPAPASEGAARLKQPQPSPPGMHPQWHKFLPGMFR